MQLPFLCYVSLYAETTLVTPSHEVINDQNVSETSCVPALFLPRKGQKGCKNKSLLDHCTLTGRAQCVYTLPREACAPCLNKDSQRPQFQALSWWMVTELTKHVLIRTGSLLPCRGNAPMPRPDARLQNFSLSDCS